MRNKGEYKLLILPVLSALLLAVSRLPLHLGFLSYCGFIPLLYFFDSYPDRKTILQGAVLFSFTYCITALHWINLVTVPGFTGMILLFSLYFWIVFSLCRIVWQKNRRWRYLIFILLWLSYEHLQNYGQFAFPWFYTAYSLADYTTLLQPAEIGGVTLVSLYVMVTNLLIYLFGIKREKTALVALVVMHLAWTGYSTIRYQTIKLEPTGERAGIVQVSIPQDVKWKSAWRDTTFMLYDEYTGKISDDTGLVILPESAIPGYVLRSMRYQSFVKRLVRKHDKAIFTGFPDYVYDEESEDYLYYNGCSLFDNSRTYYPPYYKNILVPFGERMPLLSIMPILNQIELGQANWEYGDSLRYYHYRSIKFSPQICFEVAFPGFNAELAAGDPVFIVNLTNDAWFKHSAGTYQHAVMTKFRAIETRTQYFRSANTGYSMIVNPRGDIQAKTRLFERETIEDEIINYPGKSPFVSYFRWFPDLLAGLCALLLLWTLIKKS